jgi:transposase, IS30 family
MARFSNAQVAEAVQPFWAALQAGEFIADAAVRSGTYRKQGTRWVAACGGVRPRRGRTLKGRCLSFAEREEIALARARGETMRAIARRLGRSPSTVSRELRRNADRRGYRATTAHALAYERASRPKPAKLQTNLALRQVVQDALKRRFSPEQIAGRLRRRFPGQPEMWVSTETIYQSLYVQSRGALRRELTRYLRNGRALRKPGRQAGQRKNRIPDMVNIAQRPPEAQDRAVPGHWEGDLLIGKRNATAIATLVERASGYAMLVLLPDGYKPEHVAPALTRKVQTLPETLRRSLTWDQAPEMRDWKQIHIDTGIEVFFCDPHAPWQRGSNENTNGLPRQYSPQGHRLRRHQRGAARRRRRRTQRPPPQAARLRQPDRAARRAAVAITARIRRTPNGIPAPRAGRSALARRSVVPYEMPGDGRQTDTSPLRVQTQAGAAAVKSRATVLDDTRARRPDACRRPQPRAKAAQTGARGRTSLDRPEGGRANPSPTGTSILACAPCERATGRRRRPPRNRAAQYRRPPEAPWSSSTSSRRPVEPGATT